MWAVDFDEARTRFQRSNPRGVAGGDDPVTSSADAQQSFRESLQLGLYVHVQRSTNPVGDDVTAQGSYRALNVRRQRAISAGEQSADQRQRRRHVPNPAWNSRDQRRRWRFDKRYAQHERDDLRTSVSDEQCERAGERFGEQHHGVRRKPSNHPVGERTVVQWKLVWERLRVQREVCGSGGSEAAEQLCCAVQPRKQNDRGHPHVITIERDPCASGHLARTTAAVSSAIAARRIVDRCTEARTLDRTRGHRHVARRSSPRCARNPVAQPNSSRRRRAAGRRRAVAPSSR